MRPTSWTHGAGWDTNSWPRLGPDANMCGKQKHATHTCGQLLDRGALTRANTGTAIDRRRWEDGKSPGKGRL